LRTEVMDCGSVDLKAFSLGEATAGERQVVELHVKSCGACREELSRMELTFASLGALRDEEIPKRIAFVSDQVFEPAWWQKLWNSGSQLGFASAGVLAVALVFHATYQRPTATTAQTPQVQRQTSGQAALTDDQIQKRIDDAVIKAVATVEERQKQRTAELIAASEKKQYMDRQALLLAVEDQNSLLQKKMNAAVKLIAGLN
jgi:anti-sigma-K factor RskA